MRANEPFRHHASHTTLLNRILDAHRETSLDAIIVPTARPVHMLDKAFSLGTRLGRPLVLLCSRRSDARSAIGLARATGVAAVAIDVAAEDDRLMPRWGTADMLASTVFVRRSDTSRKRNIGLLLARLAGWHRVMFLDDDIAVPHESDVRHAAGLLDRYDRVGLYNHGFPDNSVVCHAYRAVGGPQDQFVGGGALLVVPAKVSSFFPDIYNEDWFFLLDGERPGRVAVTGTSEQDAYNPFSGPERAQSQEFGDCLAEGLYSLLDQGDELDDADEQYWRAVLDARRVLIDEVAAAVPDLAALEPADRQRMRWSLNAARHRLARIAPDLCVRYLAAWRADRASWRGHLERFAVRSLGLELRTALGILLARSHSSTRPADGTERWRDAAA